MEGLNEKFKVDFSFGPVLHSRSLTVEPYEAPKGDAKQKQFAQCLHDMKDVLDSRKTRFFLCSGTFLGQHRENRFIPSDQDIDLGVFRKDYHPNIVKAVVNSGNFKLKATHGTINESLEHTFQHRNGTNIDIFVFYPLKKRDTYYITSVHGECDKTKEGYCMWERVIRGLVVVSFFGRSYRVPSNKEEYLVKAYGKGWRTPRSFTYQEGVEKGLYGGLMNRAK